MPSFEKAFVIFVSHMESVLTVKLTISFFIIYNTILYYILFILWDVMT